MIQEKIKKAIFDFKKITRTTAFRFSLFFTVTFSFVTIISMTFIHQATTKEISKQIDSRLYSASNVLIRIIQSRILLDFYQVTKGLIEKAPSQPGMHFCLVSKSDIDPYFVAKIQQNKSLILTNSFGEFCKHPSNNRNYYINQPLRMMLTEFDLNNVLVLGYDSLPQQNMMRNMSIMVYWVTAILLIASFAGSFILSRNITSSITRIGRTARLIVDGDFSERIITSKNDSEELQILASNLNHMLDRIEALINSQRQITSNVAHDLRSPLNRLRNRMEVALLDKDTNCEIYREVIAQSVQDVGNLLNTFNAIMSIAQVESRTRDDFSSINLSQICQDLAELFEVMSEEDGHIFSYQIEENLIIMGNRQLIAQAITNLLDNAFKYTPNQGKISLQAKMINQKIIVAVDDTGVGIPADKREEVLKRFVRLDSARTMPGNGLGLSLVSAIINLHAGNIELKNSQDNPPIGLRIELHLPTAEKFIQSIRKTQSNNKY